MEIWREGEGDGGRREHGVGRDGRAEREKGGRGPIAI